jgi:hypothetical protein
VPRNITVTVILTDNGQPTGQDIRQFEWVVRDRNRIVPIAPRTDVEGFWIDQWVDVNVPMNETYAVYVSNLPPGLFFDAVIQKISGYVSFDAVTSPDVSHSYDVVIRLETNDGSDYYRFPWTIMNRAYEELPDHENQECVKTITLEVWEGESLYLAFPEVTGSPTWTHVSGELPPDLQWSSTGLVTGRVSYGAVTEEQGTGQFLCVFSAPQVGILQVIWIVHNVRQEDAPKVISSDLEVNFILDAYIPEWFDKAPIGWWASFGSPNYNQMALIYKQWDNLGRPPNSNPPPPRTDADRLIGYEYVVGLGDGRGPSEKPPEEDPEKAEDQNSSYKAYNRVGAVFSLRIAVDHRGGHRIQSFAPRNEYLQKADHIVRVGRSVISFDWDGVRSSVVWDPKAWLKFPKTYGEFKTYIRKYAITDSKGQPYPQPDANGKIDPDARDSNADPKEKVNAVFREDTYTVGSIHNWVRTPFWRRLRQYLQQKFRGNVRLPDIPKIDWHITKFEVKPNEVRNDLQMWVFFSHDGYPNWEGFITLKAGNQVDSTRVYEYDHNNPPRKEIDALRGDGTEMKPFIFRENLNVFKVIAR